MSLLNFLQYFFCVYVLVLWPQGLCALISPTRKWTHAPWIARQSLNHWTTREVPIDDISVFWIQKGHSWTWSLCWDHVVPDCLTSLAGQLTGLSAGDSALLHLADVAGYPVFLWQSSQSRRGGAEQTWKLHLSGPSYPLGQGKSQDQSRFKEREDIYFHSIKQEVICDMFNLASS